MRTTSRQDARAIQEEIRMAFMSLAGAAIPAIINGISSAQNTNSVNSANANLNSANMAWQERMSNTAMQRRVEDLKKAGLNPLLATGQQGASTPSPSMIPMQKRDAIDLSSAVQLANVMADTKVKEANAASIIANTPTGINEPPRTTAQLLLQANSEAAWKDVHIKDQQLQQAITQTSILAENLKKATAEATSAAAHADQAAAQEKAITAAQQLANIVKTLDIPEAKANAALWNDAGEGGKSLTWAAKIAQAVKSILLH